jgi:acyl-[acyl-carrier-protein] desaturase
MKTAMLDRATEDALYAHFTDYFRRAEEKRRWNLWNDVPWEAVNPGASDDLTDAVEAAYAEELLLPDYSEQLIHRLRGSRGRAWFLTRWSYEEGKHLLVLAEWLMRSGKRTDDQLKESSYQVLGERSWRLSFEDPIAAMAETLLREHQEIVRYERLLPRAHAEHDGALSAVLHQLLSDEMEHRAFFRDALLLLKERLPDRQVEEGVRRVAELPAAERFASTLLRDVGLTEGD